MELMFDDEPALVRLPLRRMVLDQNGLERCRVARSIAIRGSPCAPFVSYRHRSGSHSYPMAATVAIWPLFICPDLCSGLAVRPFAARLDPGARTRLATRRVRGAVLRLQQKWRPSFGSKLPSAAATERCSVFLPIMGCRNTPLALRHRMNRQRDLASVRNSTTSSYSSSSTP